MSYVEKVQGGSVNWGGMVAGAAAVTGAVLVGSIVLGSTVTVNGAEQTVGETIGNYLGETFTNLSTYVKSALGFETGTAAGAAAGGAADAVGRAAEEAAKDPSFFQNLGTWLQDNGQLLGGSALLGGGVAGLVKSNDTAYVVQPAVVPAVSHVENEQMRAIQGLMKARMMAANPEYMAQVTGQGRA